MAFRSFMIELVAVAFETSCPSVMKSRPEFGPRFDPWVFLLMIPGPIFRGLLP